MWALAAWMVAATGSPGGAVAVLPVAGEQLSLEDVPLYRALDEAIRQAVTAAGDPLQDVALTKANVAAARDVGVDCGLDDAGCLGRLAVLTNARRLLVPLARREGAQLHVRIRVVDGTAQWADVEGDVPTGPEGAEQAAARALVADALAVALQAAATSLPPPPPPARPPPAAAAVPPAAPKPAPAASASAPAEQPLPPLALGGGTVAGAGVALAIAGGIGAAFVEDSLRQPADYRTVQAPKQALGWAFLVTAGVGVAAAGTGGALLAIALTSP